MSDVIKGFDSLIEMRSMASWGISLTGLIAGTIDRSALEM